MVGYMSTLLLQYYWLSQCFRYPPTDEVFFAQSAGPLAAGTGLKKSSAILKVSLEEAMAVSSERDAVGKVQVHVVPTEPQVINPNGMSH